MRRPKSKSKNLKIQSRKTETDEIELLQSWIEYGKPPSGSNPLSFPPLENKSPIGRLADGSFSSYAGCIKFSQLPLSKKTKDGLAKAKFVTMTDIQRASLSHSLCGRDILGAAKTGSGKTLAFIIPILEKLYQARWGPEDGVGCIIMSPTRELAGQLFDVLKTVGKYHNFSAGLLIGGRKDVDSEKEHVNNLNILVCTPGRLLQHMDETPNFECSQLQVLVLDEADRILDVGFKKELNAIISQLPKHRQTFLFSATQAKSVQDLARLSLKDPEYLSVHEESASATPDHLQQTVMTVSLDKKMDMLWSFIRAHLNSKILVFLSTCKQVKFAFETFKKLRPGIPLKCLHGRMKQEQRMGIYSQFCEKRSVLFSTDVASRGLDFDKAVDWVVQVDCPEDVDSYIHRVGRTARYQSSGRSVLFLMPSEMKMLEKLQEKKIAIRFIKANTKKLQPVSGLLSALLVKYPNLQQLAQRAFITYLKSIHKQRDKEVFDVMKLEIDDFSASLGLPMTLRIRFLKHKVNKGKVSDDTQLLAENNVNEVLLQSISDKLSTRKSKVGGEIERGIEMENDLLLQKETSNEEEVPDTKDAVSGTRILKKKKLKINLHRPIGTRMVFDEEGNTLPPLALLAKTSSDSVQLDKDKVKQRYQQLREELKSVDMEDKTRERKRLREKRMKEKAKRQRGQNEEDSDFEGEDDDLSAFEREGSDKRSNKKGKIYFNSDSDDDDGGDMKEGMDKKGGVNIDSVTLAEQEELALKLLSSMN